MQRPARSSLQRTTTLAHCKFHHVITFSLEAPFTPSPFESRLYCPHRTSISRKSDLHLFHQMFSFPFMLDLNSHLLLYSSRLCKKVSEVSSASFPLNIIPLVHPLSCSNHTLNTSISNCPVMKSFAVQLCAATKSGPMLQKSSHFLASSSLGLKDSVESRH